jgi:uncharacterized protein YyaL (SSP411 family)
MPMMVANVAFWLGGGVQIVIAGNDAPETRALEATAARQYLPWAVTVPVNTGIDAAEAGELAARLPWLAAMSGRTAQPTAYVCDRFACQQPVSEPAELQKQLEAIAAAAKIRI